MTVVMESAAVVERVRRAAANTRRAAWIDHARGIAITLVVFGHCYRGLWIAGILQSPFLDSADYFIYGFHMPLFFFISGMLGVRSAVQGGRQLWTRVRGIVWPYLLWMSCEMFLLSQLSDLTNTGRFAMGLHTYLYAPLSPFWFLYALVCCVVLVQLLVRWGTWVPVAVAIPLFVAARLGPSQFAQDLTWGIAYYTAGVAASPVVLSPGFGRRLASPVLIAAASLGAVASSLVLRSLDVSNELAVPVAVLGTVAVFGFSQHLARWATRLTWLRIVAYLGQISLTILVVHVMGTAGARIALVRTIGRHAAPWLFLPCGVAAGLGTAAVLQFVAMRFGWAGWLGLPKVPSWLRPVSEPSAPGGRCQLRAEPG